MIYVRDMNNATYKGNGKKNVSRSFCENIVISCFWLIFVVFSFFFFEFCDEKKNDLGKKWIELWEQHTSMWIHDSCDAITLHWQSSTKFWHSHTVYTVYTVYTVEFGIRFVHLNLDRNRLNIANGIANRSDPSTCSVWPALQTLENNLNV